MLKPGKKIRALCDKIKNILTLVLSEKKILNETKNHNPPPPLQVKWLVPYDTPALRQTGSRNLMGPKKLPTNMGYLYEACDQISDFCHQ